MKKRSRLAQEFGLNFVEGKQRIQGLRSGTAWEIDAEGDQRFFIVECRRYTTSKQNQEKVRVLAYRISDTGAVGGILVSPLGLQEGAAKIAAAANIISIELLENSTATDLQCGSCTEFSWARIGTSACFSASVFRVCARCGKRFVVLNNGFLCDDCKN
jgi:hypothetical protein